MARTFLSRALVGHAPPDTAALQGLRVLFSLAVVWGHTYFFVSFMLPEPKPWPEVDPHASIPAVLLLILTTVAAWGSVDVFLFVSGFCQVASLAASAGDIPQADLNRTVLRPRHAARYLLARWLRLAPLLLLTAVLSAVAGQRNCIRWREIFLSSNLFYPWTEHPVFADFCVLPSWSLAVDFQAHIVILLVLLLAPSWRAASVSLCALAAASAALRAHTWRAAGFPKWPDLSMADTVRDSTQKAQLAARLGMVPGAFDPADQALVARPAKILVYSPWYFATRSRAGAAFIGAAVWIAMRSGAPLVARVRGAPVRAVAAVAAIWTAFWMGLGVLSGEAGLTWPVVLTVLYMGFGRLAVATATGIVVILTSSVLEDGEERRSWVANGLRAVLSNPLVMWLSRGSHAVYLSHILFAPCIAGVWPRLTKENVALANLHIAAVKWYLVSVVMSVPVCLFEEACLGIRSVLIRVLFPPTGRDAVRGGRAEQKKET